jgi:hypothetical protein
LMIPITGVSVFVIFRRKRKWKLDFW